MGVFSGIGGFELGLSEAGHEVSALCEIDPRARAVLRRRFPDADLTTDVRDLTTVPETDLLALGFPCQDLSQAGRTAGIDGHQSGIVVHILDLLRAAPQKPPWLLIENVPFMLQLDRGRAIDFLVTRLEDAGYHLAYRVVDAQSFGLPQRRRRVVLLASTVGDPREVLMADDCPFRLTPSTFSYGFYWTEGNRGLGWAPDAIPTLKGGSSIGIPSPPAVWLPRRDFAGLIDIRDAERLQGFDAGWTAPADDEGGRNARWRLVGNAVAVPVARWVGRRLARPATRFATSEPHDFSRGWPTAAVGGPTTERRRVAISEHPLDRNYVPLHEFLDESLKPLSARATRGFLSRLSRSSLRVDPAFPRSLEKHLASLLA